jgi:large conductance mechanosensitive channel
MNLTEVGGEFKTFVLKGNVVDLAVGVVIGAAFGKVVESMVKDIITPMIGLIGGKPDFSNIALFAHKTVVNGKEQLSGGIMIGNFLNAVIAFLILAAVVFFLVVKPMNFLLAAAKRRAEEKPTGAAPVPDDVKLLMEIRDLLKAQAGTALPTVTAAGAHAAGAAV